MIWADLLRALGLMLVLEGLMPFLSPARARVAYQRLGGASDRLLRWVGLGSMLAGVTGLEIARLYLVD